MITIDEQIADEIDAFELHRQIHCRVDPMMAAKIASLEELKRIKSVQVPDEPDDSYWKNEAKRYAGNADYWRDRAEAAEAKLAAIKEQSHGY